MSVLALKLSNPSRGRRLRPAWQRGAVENDSDGHADFSIDDLLRDEVEVLKQLIWFYVIERPSLAIVQHDQTRTIEELYKIYEDAATAGKTKIFRS